ncbi:hypothetical protein HZP59_08820 [Elizabethkingia anophelis]|nr:hypothetical protein [Elizabethkingia anophelis]
MFKTNLSTDSAQLQKHATIGVIKDLLLITRLEELLKQTIEFNGFNTLFFIIGVNPFSEEANKIVDVFLKYKDDKVQDCLAEYVYTKIRNALV